MPYGQWNGTQLWVQEPEVYCENSGTVQCENMPDCCPDMVGSLPQTWFWAATLGCDPYYTDWTQYGVVHVFHEGIIPSKVDCVANPPEIRPGCATYDIQVVDGVCSLADEDSFSDPLRLTTSTWGDVVSDCSTTPCGPPDGSTGVVDFTAILDKWKNLPGNLQKVRADLEGSPAGDHRVPDQAINITDVTYCIGAFLGDQYPGPGFPPPSPPPDCSPCP